MHRALALVLLAALVAPVALAACGEDEQARMPRLAGLRQTQAECLLKQAGLRWRIGGRGPSRGVARVPCSRNERQQVYPDPIVRRQVPRAGARLDRGSVVSFDTDCTLLRRRGAVCL